MRSDENLKEKVVRNDPPFHLIDDQEKKSQSQGKSAGPRLVSEQDGIDSPEDVAPEKVLSGVKKEESDETVVKAKGNKLETSKATEVATATISETIKEAKAGWEIEERSSAIEPVHAEEEEHKNFVNIADDSLVRISNDDKDEEEHGGVDGNKSRKLVEVVSTANVNATPANTCESSSTVSTVKGSSDVLRFHVYRNNPSSIGFISTVITRKGHSISKEDSNPDVKTIQSQAVLSVHVSHEDSPGCEDSSTSLATTASWSTIATTTALSSASPSGGFVESTAEAGTLEASLIWTYPSPRREWLIPW